MQKKSWKILAIVFIVLFILETAFFFTILYLGAQVIENEITCSNEICVEVEASSFIYDQDTKLCSCYNGFREVIFEEYLD